MYNEIISLAEHDALLEDMGNLLSKYNYTYTKYGLERIIDEWCEQKGAIIKLLKKHPNYLEGKFMVTFNQSYTREVDENAIHNFFDWLVDHPVMGMVDDLPERIQNWRKNDHCTCLPRSIFSLLVNTFAYHTDRTINADLASQLKELIPEIHPHTGQKTSRVVNKLCEFLGYSKHSYYNRRFSIYADALNPLTITRHTILSVNPLDYLTMSFGNSWTSCHTIDKLNLRDAAGGYNGMHASGTMSYMLDGTSMVFYTVDGSYNGDDYWNQDKITRQMFHFGEDKLIQSRLYPQDNDSASNDLYTQYRNVVQEIMATLLDMPNLWVLKTGAIEASRCINSYGTHYRDYHHVNRCTVSIIKGSENTNRIDVGANPICIECGDEHDCDNTINCCRGVLTCSRCGCSLDDEDEDDIIYIDGEPYCSDCVFYCDDCHSYHLETERNYVYNGSVCDSCFQDYKWCDSCEHYHHKDDVNWVATENIYVCDDCLHQYYVKCTCCDDYLDPENAVYIDGKPYCDSCANEKEDEERAE